MRKLLAAGMLLLFCVSCAAPGGSLRGISCATKPSSTVPEPVPPAFTDGNNTALYVTVGVVGAAALVAIASNGGGGSGDSSGGGSR